jgi:hypothetical protein
MEKNGIDKEAIIAEYWSSKPKQAKSKLQTNN